MCSHRAETRWRGAEALRATAAEALRATATKAPRTWAAAAATDGSSWGWPYGATAIPSRRFAGARLEPDRILAGPSLFERYSTGWPLAVSATSMLPRVAFEYGQTRWA